MVEVFQISVSLFTSDKGQPGKNETFTRSVEAIHSFLSLCSYYSVP